jgi:hypothetical protein
MQVQTLAGCAASVVGACCSAATYREAQVSRCQQHAHRGEEIAIPWLNSVVGHCEGSAKALQGHGRLHSTEQFDHQPSQCGQADGTAGEQ